MKISVGCIFLCEVKVMIMVSMKLLSVLII